MLPRATMLKRDSALEYVETFKPYRVQNGSPIYFLETSGPFYPLSRVALHLSCIILKSHYILPSQKYHFYQILTGPSKDTSVPGTAIQEGGTWQQTSQCRNDEPTHIFFHNLI